MDRIPSQDLRTHDAIQTGQENWVHHLDEPRRHDEAARLAAAALSCRPVHSSYVISAEETDVFPGLNKDSSPHLTAAVMSGVEAKRSRMGFRVKN